MVEKINSKQNFKFLIINFKLPIFILLVALLLYTRFINIGWGLPYPMHPDERNMASAIQGLNCVISNFEFRISNFRECGNPHFFAYGQFSLYLGYVFGFVYKLYKGTSQMSINYDEAAIGLRMVSALASILNAIIIIKIIKVINKKNNLLLSLISCLIIIFSPFFIQFSHFGTTESLLMLFYSLIIYYCLLFSDKEISTSSFVLKSAIIGGLALATKVSSGIFLITPFFLLLLNNEGSKYKTTIYKWIAKLIDIFIFGFLTFIIFLIFSPHNFLNLNDFLSSMNYESDVALGRALVFYTRQFFETTPIVFQFEKVFPYVLGWPVFLMGLIGLIGANWKEKKINLLRFAFLVYFIPSAFFYAKWSRFMAPILPIMTIFAILFIAKIRVINFIKIIIIIFSILPGVAYLHIYQSDDVRFQASDWIYKNIPSGKRILYDTANVVDVPIVNQRSKIKDLPAGNYQTVSFNFYDLDVSPELQADLKKYIDRADYIIVPSRRVFANHTCYINDKLEMTNDPTSPDSVGIRGASKNRCLELQKTYPELNKYYGDLFSGKLGFKKVAEFNSYPQIKFKILNFKFQIKFPDEQAEETWTVFDHPVIRIYKKLNVKS